ncbi:MAG: diguanylate cyclase, partial [Ectothiorhodospira sp.]
EEIKRAQRHGDALGICIMDVDHFKHINDRFGHDMGDQALCRIAAVVQDSVRSYDICGRWGGEEFLLLLPHTDCEEALAVVHRLRDCIQKIYISEGDGGVYLSASFGLTSLQVREEDPDIVLRRADQALFRAKDAGRNRVELG